MTRSITGRLAATAALALTRYDRHLRDGRTGASVLPRGTSALGCMGACRFHCVNPGGLRFNTVGNVYRYSASFDYLGHIDNHDLRL